jgi:hypothetical protein
MSGFHLVAEGIMQSQLAGVTLVPIVPIEVIKSAILTYGPAVASELATYLPPPLNHAARILLRVWAK